MLSDFLLNLLASLTYDLLKALGKRLPREGDLRRALSEALRQNTEALQALQAALTRLGAPRVVSIAGDVSGSVIVLGDGNRLTVSDDGALVQRWLAWAGTAEQARRAYLESLAGRAAWHIFPLSKLSFRADLAALYQPPAFARYFGEWRPSLRRARERLSLEDLLSAASPCALTAPLGEGKSTTLRYLTWVYAARPEGRFLPGLNERLPFHVTARRLYEEWKQAADPLVAWAQAAAEFAPLQPALVYRVLKDALEEGDALLLLDALDETRLPAEPRAEFLAALRALFDAAPWRGNFLLLTSRPHVFLQSGFAQFAIQEMSAESVRGLAYRLGLLLLEERARQGQVSPSDPPSEAALERLTRLTERSAPARFGTPFYVTLLVLAALRRPDLERGLQQAESLRGLAELYLFFLRQALR
ncbi:MAG: NACHT domain-containing protein, partial [Anaerolineae bacterium]